VSAAVSVAVIDSGANVPHPHLPSVAGGVGVDLEGSETGDWIDVLGHGTAVAAAIHEKAPSAEIFAVKVFQRELATTARALVRAIDWATTRGMRLVNLSLGTPLELRAAELEPVVERAGRAGSIIVSAFELDGHPWYPGCMEGVVGVCLDPDQPRESVAVEERGGRPVVRASPYPRPVPGVPKERNLNGISFAVANATGCLAAALALRPDVRTADAAVALLRESVVSTPGAL
jgi:hypothetical protein